MPNRKYAASGLYKYGFNGKEMDNEVKGDGVSYDYGFRVYDSRLGRFLSTDPLTVSYPWYTPYQFAGNMPIVAIDLDGLEEYVVTNYYDKSNKLIETVISTVTDRKTGNLVNLQLQKDDGIYVAEQNVLVRNVSHNGATSYAHQSGLSPAQKNIVAKASQKILNILTDEGGTFFYGQGEEGDPDDDQGEFIQSESDKFTKSKYRVSRYSSKDIIKPKPVAPKPVTSKTTPPKAIAKDPPISKNPIRFESTMEFQSYSVHFKEGGVNTITNEVNKIVSMVKQTGVTNYSITIAGNVATGGEGWQGDDYLEWNSTHKNYGSLAMKRANAIKEKLVAAGLDASKFSTKLGSPEKAISADYTIILNQ